MASTSRARKASRPSCLLCSAVGIPVGSHGLYEHPVSDACSVCLFEADGTCVDDRFELDNGTLYQLGDTAAPEAHAVSPQQTESGSSASTPGLVFFTTPSYRNVDEALGEIFVAAGLERLGGASGDRGWSSVSTFQRCPHLWAASYHGRRPARSGVDPAPLQIGSLVHTFLAVHYEARILSEYPLTPESVREACLTLRVNPEIIDESWRVFVAYRIFYGAEGVGSPHDVQLRPLAVEHRVADPKTGRSARYDLVAEVPEATMSLTAGTWIFEHKTSGRFDDATLDGWRNDGEILGQIDLWETLKLEKRFGKLQGVVVNILGKQKKPEFHRTIVSPLRWQTRDHRRSMAIWGAEIDRAVATNVFPRARAHCIGRYGKCPLFDSCSEDKG